MSEYVIFACGYLCGLLTMIIPWLLYIRFGYDGQPRQRVIDELREQMEEELPENAGRQPAAAARPLRIRSRQ